MNVINYQKELDKIIERLQREGRRPSLLLHSCCAPCSSYCMEYLTQYFDITIYYYNPNITDGEEYRHRVEEQQRLIQQFPGVKFEEGPYDPESFFEIAKGLETVPEGGERCFRCYELRLKQAVEAAKLGGYDYVTTTLTISPLKNSKKLNEIGGELVSGNKVAKQESLELESTELESAELESTELESTEHKNTLSWLPSDFKKKNGYKRSVELSAQYDLYRQDYCGCIYSKEEAERRKSNK